ncbi:hypothetical protein LTS08_008874 [Lithohypha guttulata]|nr:hypothetical protein LTS08_008874 [Lithohypha guttulata]
MASTSRYDPDFDRLDMEIILEEDVMAELEDFAFLSQLGLVDESYKLLEAVVWRHLKHFPVVAEIGAFAIDNGDADLVLHLFVEKVGRRIQYTEEQEHYLRTLALWTRNELDANTIRAIESPSNQHEESDDSLRYEQALFAEPDFTSTIALQNIEIRIRAAAIDAADAGIPNSIIKYAEKHFWRLEHHALHSEAVRMFTALAGCHEMLDCDIDVIREMYESLLQQFEPCRPRSTQRTSEETEPLDTIQVVIDLFHTQFAYLRLLVNHVSSSPREVKSLHSQVENLLLWLFQNLPYDRASMRWADVWNEISSKVTTSSERLQPLKGQGLEQQRLLKESDSPAQQHKMIDDKWQGLSPSERQLYEKKARAISLSKPVWDIPQRYEKEQDSSATSKRLSYTSLSSARICQIIICII